MSNDPICRCGHVYSSHPLAHPAPGICIDENADGTDCECEAFAICDDDLVDFVAHAAATADEPSAPVGRIRDECFYPTGEDLAERLAALESSGRVMKNGDEWSVPAAPLTAAADQRR